MIGSYKLFPRVYLNQGLAHNGQGAKSVLTPGCVNTILQVTYCLGLFLLQQERSCHRDPAKPKIFTICPFTGMVCWPGVYTDMGSCFGIHFRRSLSILGSHNANTNAGKACSQLSRWFAPCLNQIWLTSSLKSMKLYVMNSIPPIRKWSNNCFFLLSLVLGKGLCDDGREAWLMFSELAGCLAVILWALAFLWRSAQGGT